MSVTLSTLSSRSSERAFYTTMAVCIAVVVFIGFSRTFFLRFAFPGASEYAAPEPFFYVHGVFFAAWFALLVAQTSFIGSGRVRLHRRFGFAGVGLAGAMVALGAIGALIAARRPGGFIGLTQPPLEFLAIPIFDLLLFGVFVALAALWRRDVQAHKRLMLIATINIMEAAIVRIPVSLVENGGVLMAFWLADVFLAALVLWDVVSLKRLHAVTLWAGVATVVSQPLRFEIARTDAWLAFAGWAVGLLG